MDESTEEDRALRNSQCLLSDCQAFTLGPLGENSSHQNGNTCFVNFQSFTSLMLRKKRNYKI